MRNSLPGLNVLFLCSAFLRYLSIPNVIALYPRIKDCPAYNRHYVGIPLCRVSSLYPLKSASTRQNTPKIGSPSVYSSLLLPSGYDLIRVRVQNERISPPSGDEISSDREWLLFFVLDEEGEFQHLLLVLWHNARQIFHKFFHRHLISVSRRNCDSFRIHRNRPGALSDTMCPNKDARPAAINEKQAFGCFVVHHIRLHVVIELNLFLERYSHLAEDIRHAP